MPVSDRPTSPIIPPRPTRLVPFTVNSTQPLPSTDVSEVRPKRDRRDYHLYFRDDQTQVIFQAVRKARQSWGGSGVYVFEDLMVEVCRAYLETISTKEELS